jgi:hypothetical protein
MRTPLSLPAQIQGLQWYIRTLRADETRASREEARYYRKQRICPLVVNLSYQRIRNARELGRVAEAGLAQLRHAHVLSIAEFFPGDLIEREIVDSSLSRPAQRFVLTDVQWSRSGRYHYVVWPLTRDLQLSKRGTSWMSCSRQIRLLSYNARLPAETQRECEYIREQARRFVDEIRDHGDIEDIVKQVRDRKVGFFAV